jgi:hypothetical protein
LTAAGTSASTAELAAGVEVGADVAVEVDVEAAADDVEVELDDELLLPHPASATTPTSETHIFHLRISALLKLSETRSIRNQRGWMLEL